MHLYLARHGNTFEAEQTPVQVGAKTDLPLTNKGVKQAEIFAQYLKDHHITPKAIFAGFLQRQTTTACIIAKQLHLENHLFLQEPALDEIDYGLWEGLSADEISNKWPKESHEWTENSIWPDHIFVGTEKNHLKRIDDWLNQLRQKYSPNDVIIGITSNGIIRYFRPDRTGDVKVKTGNFCELEVNANSIIVKSWNQSV